MTAIIWKRPEIVPVRRVAMPLQKAAAALTRPGYRLIPVNMPGMAPHFHIDLDVAPEKRPLRLDAAYQALVTSIPRSVVACADFGCSWFANGHEGISDGKPFKHPAGVECGDFAACTDPNCPCPDNTLEWPNGDTRGHVGPCRYCSGSMRYATSTGARAVTADELIYRIGEGLDSLATIRKRGL